MNSSHTSPFARIACLFLVLLGACSSPASKYSNYESETVNLNTGKWWHYLTLKESVPAPGVGFRDLYGLADADGDIILEPKYSTLGVISSQIAWASLEDGYAIFDIEEERFQSTRYESITDLGWHFLGINWPGELELMDIYILDKQTGAEVAILEGIEGYTRLKDLLIVHKTLDDGSQVSQVLDGSGKQISPVISRVIGEYVQDDDVNLGFIVGAVEPNQADLQHRTLYIPLGTSGTPLDLPSDCIGMIPLGVELSAPKGPYKFNLNRRGWVIVYETPSGLEFSVETGSVDAIEILANAEFLQRYKQLALWETTNDPYFPDPFSPNFLLVKESVGGWKQLHLKGLKPYLEVGEAEHAYASVEELKDDLGRISTNRTLAREAREAAELAAERKLKAEQRERRIARFEEAMAAGDRSAAWDLGRYDDEIFLLCMDRMGSRLLESMLRYDRITGGNLYAEEVQAYYDAALAREQAEYDRQVAISAQLQREADREAYKHRNDWSTGSSGGQSLFDQTMQDSKAWKARNRASWLNGGNVVYYPDH